MAEYIERERLIEVLERNFFNTPGCSEMKLLIESLPAAMSEWISVEDRLPEDCLPKSSKLKQIKVLVAIKAINGYCVRSEMRMKNKYYEEKDIWSWGKFAQGQITHWQPLPKPPKED